MSSMTSEVGEVEDAVDQAVRWVAEAAQRANHNSDDARALLREALSQDIQKEMKGKQRERKAGATGAVQRLHSDSLRRQAKEADKSGGSSLGDTSPSQMDRKEASMRMNHLMLEQMREGKEGEVRSLNKKYGIKPPKKKNGAHEERSPDKSYHELLYEEGMLSLEARHSRRPRRRRPRRRPRPRCPLLPPLEPLALAPLHVLHEAALHVARGVARAARVGARLERELL